jgi:hypothetical protein
MGEQAVDIPVLNYSNILKAELTPAANKRIDYNLTSHYNIITG